VRDDAESGMGIAELAARAGVTPRTIRYYVAEGLLPAPGGRGQRRAYTQEHLDRLATIGRLKAAYLPLHEIRRRLAAAPDFPPLRTWEDVGAGPGRPERASASRMDCESKDIRAAQRLEVGATSGPGVAALTTTGAPDRTGAPVATMPASRPLLGFGGAPTMGRIEIYDPPETVWHRHVLAPGVELHVQQTDDLRLAEAIQRLLREAAAILDE